MLKHRVQSILSSFTGVATIVLLCVILNLLAILNCFMQRKMADFSRLKIILDSVLDQLRSLQLSDAECMVFGCRKNCSNSIN